MTYVLDASAVLAYLNDEPGGGEVTEVIAATARIGAANWAEVLSKLAERGQAPADVVSRLRDAGVLGALLEVEPLTADDAVVIAQLRTRTRDAGLSLADRACLALGARLALPVVTADRAWQDLDLDVDIHSIR